MNRCTETHLCWIVSQSTLFAAGAAIGYGSPLTMTDTSSKIKHGTKGDVTELRPTLMTAVPAILDRIREGVRKKVCAGSLFQDSLREELTVLWSSCWHSCTAVGLCLTDGDCWHDSNFWAGENQGRLYKYTFSVCLQAQARSSGRKLVGSMGSWETSLECSGVQEDTFCSWGTCAGDAFRRCPTVRRHSTVHQCLFWVWIILPLTRLP